MSRDERTALLREAAALLEDWVEVLQEEAPNINTGTLKGTARRIRDALANSESPPLPEGLARKLSIYLALGARGLTLDEIRYVIEGPSFPEDALP